MNVNETYTVTHGDKTYFVTEEFTRRFREHQNPHDYIRDHVYPWIDRFEWFKLENNILRYRNRILLS